MAKHHLNSLLNNDNILGPYPLMMIMGFGCVFTTLEFIENIGNILKHIDHCCFPITKQGGIERKEIVHLKQYVVQSVKSTKL